MKSPLNPGSFSRAFTLVEMLVVLSIIAGLAALLLPALRGARARSRTAQCASNERQVGTGWASYLSDHNGYYPYQAPEAPFGDAPTMPCSYQPDCTVVDPESGQYWRANYGGTISNWQKEIAPYLGGQLVGGEWPLHFRQLMRCRANPWPTPDGTGVWYRENTFSYQANLSLLPMTWRCGGAVSCGAKPNSPPSWHKRTHMSDIRHPNGAAMLLENPLCPSINGRVDNEWSRLNPATFANLPMPFPGGVGWGVSSSSVTNIFDYAGNPPVNPTTWVRTDCNYVVSTFHGLGMNVLFFDGHVERVPKATLLGYSVELQTPSSGPAWAPVWNRPRNTPGSIFWTDGYGINGMNTVYGSEYLFFGEDQFPGYQTYP